MGLSKDVSMMYEERGYKHSEKCICGNCVSDEFLSSKLRKSGNRGKCSFCGGRRNVVDFDDFARYISEYIKHNYDRAIDCLSYDREDGYFGETINTNEIIDNISEEISDNTAVIDELKNIFFDESYTSEFKYMPYELDEELWDKYCELLRQRKESAEAIVSMCKRKDKPEDVIEIDDILHAVLSVSEDMYMRETIRGLPIYRTVNYLVVGEVTTGFERIIASYIGTPPPSKCAENRFSERGDMVFYGSSNEEINKKEIGQPEVGKVFTTGKFYTNKRITVLNYSSIAQWKRPSLFDIGNKEERKKWFFLNRLVDILSRKIETDKKEDLYRPTQVFMKYIQRNTKYYGICYRSSKSTENDKNSSYVKDKCYALFATNRDCIDKCEKAYKLDTSRLQMIMVDYTHGL